MTTVPPIDFATRHADKHFRRICEAAASGDDRVLIDAFVAAGVPPYIRRYDDGRVEFVVCADCGAPFGDPDPGDPAPRCPSCASEPAP